MILLLIDWLQGIYGNPVGQFFTYTTTRLILACITAIMLSLYFGPWFIKKMAGYRQPIRDLHNDNGFLLGKLHKAKKNTPTMGGLLILVPAIISLLIWMDLTHPFTLILLIATVVLGILGAIDDLQKLRYQNHRGVSAKTKLLVQFLVALFVIAYLQVPPVTRSVERYLGIKPPQVKEFASSTLPQKQLTLKEYSSRIYLPCLKEPLIIFSGIGLIAVWVFFSFVIVGCSNAVNLSDGLDGLAPGLVIFVAASLAIVAFVSNNQEIADYLNIIYIEGAGEVAIFLSAISGATIGFLWFNSHPAEIFMGDVGSLALGGIIGISAILIRRELLLGLVGALFVAEALSVVLQVISYRCRNKKRIFLCAPLHHHFEYLGWAESKVVIRFWILGFLLALLGLLTLKLQ